MINDPCGQEICVCLAWLNSLKISFNAILIFSSYTIFTSLFNAVVFKRWILNVHSFLYQSHLSKKVVTLPSKLTFNESHKSQGLQ